MTIDSSSLLEMRVSPCTEKSTEFIRSVFSRKVLAERKFLITCSVNFIVSKRIRPRRALECILEKESLNENIKNKPTNFTTMPLTRIKMKLYRFQIEE